MNYFNESFKEESNYCNYYTDYNACHASVLEEQEDYTNDPLFETLSAFVKEHGYKNGYVMWPLRTAVSGKQMTPAGATEIMEIIGKDETIKRVKAAIEKLSK